MSDAPHGPPEPEPVAREFQPKSTDFERVNRPLDEFTPGDTPIDALQINRQAASPPPAQAAASSPPRENEVHAILRDNLARAQAKGLNEVVPLTKRPSRRKRDYWLLLIGGNLLVVASVGVMHKNVITLAFGFSAMVFCSLALTWIMWFVLDDY